MTGGQALARQLALEGITDLFCIPGVQLDWAFDGMRDVEGRVKLWVPRHEQTASYMADGYARSTGKIGTCMVVPGPGLLNAMSGLADAFGVKSASVRTPDDLDKILPKALASGEPWLIEAKVGEMGDPWHLARLRPSGPVRGGHASPPNPLGEPTA